MDSVQNYFFQHYSSPSPLIIDIEWCPPKLLMPPKLSHGIGVCALTTKPAFEKEKIGFSISYGTKFYCIVEVGFQKCARA